MDLKSLIENIIEGKSQSSEILHEATSDSDLATIGSNIFEKLIGKGSFGKVKHTSTRGMDFVEADVNFKKLFGAAADLLWKKMTIKIELFEKSEINGYVGRVELRWEHTDGGRNGYTIGGGVSNGKSTITWTDQSDAQSALARWGKG